MDPFSYIVVLTSIVLGLGVTRLVGGFGYLLQRRKPGQVYWVHTLWLVNLLIVIAVEWWVAYRWRTAERWTFVLFLWLLLSPMLLYLISSILFPGDEELQLIDRWENYFFENHRRIFLLLAACYPLDLIDTLLKGLAHFRAQGPIYFCSMILLMTLALIAAFTKKRGYHGFYAVFFSIYNVLLVGSIALTDQGFIGGTPP
jgi:hypothetical protein